MTGDTSFRDDAITLVGRAVLAPSSHNTQPWRFRVSDAVIDLFADRAPCRKPFAPTQVTARGFPQIVLRLGYPSSEIAAAPRRPLEDVLETTG